MSLVRSLVSGIATNDRVAPLLASTGVGRGLVHRVAGGRTPVDAMESVRELADSGRLVSLDRHWSPERSADLDGVVADYESMIGLLGAAGLGAIAEIVIPPPLLAMTRGPEALNAVCAVARDAGVSVLIDTGPPDDVDACLAAARRQRAIGREVGVGLQASLRRTEQDCAVVGGRVRLARSRSGPGLAGAGRHGHVIEVDKAYVRCAKLLLARGDEVMPSFATHDARFIEIVQSLAARYGRHEGQFEFAMGVDRAEDLQRRLVDAGQSVRVFVPFGPERMGRLVGGLAERPNGLASAVRGILPGA